MLGGIVFGIPTHGCSVEYDRIVEIAILKIHPNGKKTKFRSLVNPKMPIPPEATKVHGISDKDVKRKPSFRKLAAIVERILRACDLVGFNAINFDLPLLRKEFERGHVTFTLDERRILDPCRIFIRKEPRNLPAAYSFYCGREHTAAHSALGDARACWHVLRVTDSTLGLAERVSDPREEERVRHSVLSLFRQRLYQIIAGYEDANDADRLRHDPAFQILADQPLGEPLGSQPTLSRWENSPSPRELLKLQDALLDWFVKICGEQVRKRGEILLDVDSTDDPTHGQQQLSFFNGGYDQHMYHPLLIFERHTGCLLAARLRQGTRR